MKRCNECGTKVGLFKSGLCDNCRSQVDEVEKVIALFRRVNANWHIHPRTGPDDDGYYREESYTFRANTPDGDDADDASGGIGQDASNKRWGLSVSVNKVLLAKANCWVGGWIYTETLQPYILSIPAVQDAVRDGIRKSEDARKTSELEIQREQDLKRKYGV